MYNNNTFRSDISHLILSCNPNVDSLTVRAATQSCKILSDQNIPHYYYHLDSIAYNPVLPLEEIQRRVSFDEHTRMFQKILAQIQVLGLFFPDWWGFPPALLIGWLQRVFAPGVAFIHEGEEFLPKHITPLLAHLRVILAITSDEKDRTLVQESSNVLSNRIFIPAGITQVDTFILPNTKYSSIHERNNWLAHIYNTL